MATQIMSDGRILQEIYDSLAWDERVDACEVVVDVAKGVVTLSGTVRTYAEKTVAVEDAWKIRGVRRVVDKITVSPEELRLDGDIALDVVNMLEGDSRLEARNVVVKVSGSVVELSGTVVRLAEKEAAEEDAWFVPGVVDVANNLDVSPAKVRPDPEIADDIRTAIVRDSRIGDATSITVASSGGKVSLQGEVRTPGERRAVEEDARFTAGVIEVQNEIEVVLI